MRMLFLDLDTLRPDHLGCYGYFRNTSPNIDRIARRGIKFDNYYCSDAPCLPSRTALMSGRFGIHTGVVGHGGTAADMRLEGRSRDFHDVLSTSSLPSFLRSVGFRTVSVSPFAERHSSWSFYAGFNEMYNTGKLGCETAEEITGVALKWLENNIKEDNWFLHLNYWDPHTPYRVPEGYGNPFEDAPIPEWITDEVLEKHRKKIGPHSAREINMFDNHVDSNFARQPGEIKDKRDLRQLFDGYDCGIRYMDDQIGHIFELLEKHGVFDDMAIIISADHGENMGELGVYAEHATADNITCRIPMIISWPGGKKGHADHGLHYNLDLAPTLAELFSRESSKLWDGRSYASSILTGNDTGRNHLVLSQCAHVCQRSVRLGKWIYIRTYHDGFHLFPDEMLFNMEEDPNEENNVAKDYPQVCMEAVFILNKWHDDMMKSMSCDIDPMWTVIKEGGPFHARGRLKSYCNRLEQTGRADGIVELKKRHPEEF